VAAVFCQVELFIPAAGSLKGKRQVVQSIIGRLRSRCSAAVAETGHQDAWQRAALEIAMVASSRAILEKQVALARRTIEDADQAEIAAFSADYL
jgi:uncharacterized protein YlxP (DUF503 family)